MSLVDQLLPHTIIQSPLARKMVGAAGWGFLQLFSNYAFRLCSNLVMTRLLMPDAFGLLALATTIITALVLFTDVGISQSVIREKDGDQKNFMRTAWSLKVVMSWVVVVGMVLVGGLTALIAPQLATPGTIYADPRLPWVIMLCAVAPLMSGFSSTSQYVMARDLNYRLMTLVTLGAQFLAMIVMIGMAVIYPSVWSLMAGMLVQQGIISLSTHLFLPGPRMKWSWDPVIRGRLWQFGRWIIVSSSMTFFQNNIDKFFLAAQMPPQTFGLYVVAQIWLSAGKQLVSILSSQVGYPALSHVIRTNPKNLENVYRKFQMSIDAFCLGGFLFMFLGGQLLIDLMYTPIYSEAGHYMRLLSLAFLTTRFDTMGSIILNFGESRSLSIMSAIRAIGAALLLPVGYMMGGVDGMIIGTAIMGVTSAPYAIYRLSKHISLRKLGFDIIWLLAMPIMAAFVYLRS